jgi:ABC-2 type transport system permease protein
MAAVAQRRKAPSASRRPGAFAPLVRRGLRDARTRVLGFVYLFAVVAYIQPVAYGHTYPTLADRLRFARSFANNQAVVLFYGKAYDLLTVEGYTAWRVGGTLAIFAAVFGMLAAVRALRAEEDAGRTEQILAAALDRRTAFAAAMTAVALGAFALWLATTAGLVVGGLGVGGSAYLALAVVSVVAVFAGVGALVSQLASTKRQAVEIGGAAVAVSLLLRVIADTSSGAGWVRWATPLGWAEEMRPFTGARPVVLLLSAVATVVLVGLAVRLAIRRDIGTGVLATRDRAPARLGLLSSATAQGLREERTSFLIWIGGVAAMACVIGVVSDSVTSLGVTKQLQQTLEKLGAGSALTPKAYIGFSFSFFVLIVCLFCVAQVAVVRHEESDERLETLLALPVSRRGWLTGRLGLAVAGAIAVSLIAGLVAWAGAVSQGVSLSAAAMLGAGANCLPAALLFLGLAVLTYAVVPRASGAIAYGVLVLAYLWELFGALLGAPTWLVHATPFAHVAAVPAVAFRPVAAAVMVAIGAVAAIAGVLWFERRDLLGA